MASARSACDDVSEIKKIVQGGERTSQLTKRSDLEHTRHAYQLGVQYPAIAEPVCSYVFYGPEGTTLRDHDMAVCSCMGRAQPPDDLMRAAGRFSGERRFSLLPAKGQ